MSQVLVVFHGGACFDGFCSAWLMSKAYPDAEFVPAQYGEPPPDVGMRDVYLVDFCYPRDTLRRLISFNRRVTVIDHHKTAEPEIRGLDDGDGKFRSVFDVTKSGARLVWEFLHGADRPAPLLVDYTEDRDLWRWMLPHSREVNAALRSYPLEFGVWDRLAAESAESFVPEGRAILRAERQSVERHVRNASEITIAGHKVLCVNATVLQSEIAGELAKDRPFGVCYFERADGSRVYSLRSREGGVDVSEVAKLFGGGGHRNAAGFESRL